MAIELSSTLAVAQRLQTGPRGPQAALEFLQTRKAHHEGHPDYHAALGHLLAIIGDREAAGAEFREARHRRATSPTSSRTTRRSHSRRDQTRVGKIGAPSGNEAHREQGRRRSFRRISSSQPDHSASSRRDSSSTMQAASAHNDGEGRKRRRRDMFGVLGSLRRRAERIMRGSRTGSEDDGVEVNEDSPVQSEIEGTPSNLRTRAQQGPSMRNLVGRMRSLRTVGNNIVASVSNQRLPPRKRRQECSAASLHTSNRRDDGGGDNDDNCRRWLSGSDVSAFVLLPSLKQNAQESSSGGRSNINNSEGTPTSHHARRMAVGSSTERITNCTVADDTSRRNNIHPQTIGSSIHSGEALRCHSAEATYMSRDTNKRSNGSIPRRWRCSGDKLPQVSTQARSLSSMSPTALLPSMKGSAQSSKEEECECARALSGMSEQDDDSDSTDDDSIQGILSDTDSSLDLSSASVSSGPFFGEESDGDLDDSSSSESSSDESSTIDGVHVHNCLHCARSIEDEGCSECEDDGRNGESMFTVPHLFDPVSDSDDSTQCDWSSTAGIPPSSHAMSQVGQDLDLANTSEVGSSDGSMHSWDVHLSQARGRALSDEESEDYLDISEQPRDPADVLGDLLESDDFWGISRVIGEAILTTRERVARDRDVVHELFDELVERFPDGSAFHSRLTGVGFKRFVEQVAPKVLLKAADSQASETCPICHDTLGPMAVRTMPCSGKHCFHAACIDQWLNKHYTCPNCRTDLRMGRSDCGDDNAVEIEEVQ